MRRSGWSREQFSKASQAWVPKNVLWATCSRRAGDAAILDADPRHRLVGGADEDDADRAAAHVETAQQDRPFWGPARARPERHGTGRRLGRLDENEPVER